MSSTLCKQNAAPSGATGIKRFFFSKHILSAVVLLFALFIAMPAMAQTTVAAGEVHVVTAGDSGTITVQNGGIVNQYWLFDGAITVQPGGILTWDPAVLNNGDTPVPGTMLVGGAGAFIEPQVGGSLLVEANGTAITGFALYTNANVNAIGGNPFVLDANTTFNVSVGNTLTVTVNSTDPVNGLTMNLVGAGSQFNLHGNLVVADGARVVLGNGADIQVAPTGTVTNTQTNAGFGIVDSLWLPIALVGDSYTGTKNPQLSLTVAAGEVYVVKPGDNGTITVQAGGIVNKYWLFDGAITVQYGGILTWDAAVVADGDTPVAGTILVGVGGAFIESAVAGGTLKVSANGSAITGFEIGGTGTYRVYAIGGNPFVLDANTTFTVPLGTILEVFPNTVEPVNGLSMNLVGAGSLLDVKGRLLVQDGARVVLGNGAVIDASAATDLTNTQSNVGFGIVDSWWVEIAPISGVYTGGVNPPIVSTVTFDPRGGTVAPTSAVTAPDGKLTALPTPTRPGDYTFSGWFPTPSGGVQITLARVYTTNTTIYARWTYTGGGTVTPPVTTPTAPTITSASGTTVVSGVGGTFQVTASGTTPIGYSLTSAPAGVSINSATGVITIAATLAAGNYPFTITADNGTAPTSSQGFTLIVQPPSSNPPVITSANSTTVTSGAEITFKVTATGTAPISFALSGQPAGVSINGTTGVMTIAGTTAVGSHKFNITATDGGNNKATMAFTLVVNTAADDFIQKAYIAFFNRPADVPGLTYWKNYPGNAQDMLAEFSKSAEYLSDYAGMSNQQVISKVYQNLFGRLPETEGLNYWTQQMEAGWITIANVAYEILGGARNEDKTIIQNKALVANMFTAALNTPQKAEAYNQAGPMGLPNAAKTWLAAVNEENASVSEASGKLNALIQQLVERWEEFTQ